MALENTLTDAIAGLRAWKDAHQRVLTNQEELDATTETLRAVNDVTDVAPEVAQQIRSAHGRMASVLRQGISAVLPMFNPTLRISTTSRGTILQNLRTYMGDNSLEVKSRGTVIGSAVDDGGNTGNQTLLVCGTDKYDQVIESATIEDILIKCVANAANRSGLGTETYSIQGEGRANFSEFNGVGRGVQAGLFNGLEPGVSGDLRNSSFDLAFTGTGTDKIPNWDIVAGQGNIARDTANVARDRGASNHASLLITGDCQFRFDFRKQSVALNRFLPYLAGLRWKADGNNGDIIIRIGSATGTYTLTINTSNTAGVWQTATLNPNVDDAWADVFDTDGQPFFEIEVDNYVSGNIYIDDAIFRAMALRGGVPMEIVSGVTAAVVDDQHTHTRDLTVNTAGSVELTGGASGSVDSITVNGVEIMSGSVPFNTSLAQTASDVVDNINANLSAPNYRAVLNSATVEIYQIIPVEGTLTVTSTTTTITTTDVDVSGASIGLIQDSIARNLGTYLPHASSATSGWGD